ncbi:MAG: aspartyl protease family protein [Patiriisocius sp.]|jgi:aspartyl protease family protein
MGQGMMVVAFIIALGLLTMFFADIQESQYNPNQAPLSSTAGNAVEVSLLRNRQGHYVVSGEINQQTAEFLLDTGATDVVVPADLAGQLGLSRGYAAKAMTANGTVTVYETSIDQLMIGDIELRNVRASINPGMNGQSILLGMSALKQIEFVQRGDRLTLRQLY